MCGEADSTSRDASAGRRKIDRAFGIEGPLNAGLSHHCRMAANSRTALRGVKTPRTFVAGAALSPSLKM